jgi:hypothetical protein
VPTFQRDRLPEPENNLLSPKYVFETVVVHRVWAKQTLSKLSSDVLLWNHQPLSGARETDIVHGPFHTYREPSIFRPFLSTDYS